MTNMGSGYWVLTTPMQLLEVYEFTDAGKLVEDFFAAVDRMLKDGGMT
jgi:hypothetical protein